MCEFVYSIYTSYSHSYLYSDWLYQFVSAVSYVYFDRHQTMELLCCWTTAGLRHRKIPLVWKRGKVSQKQQYHVCTFDVLLTFACEVFSSYLLTHAFPCRIVVDLKEEAWYQKCHDPDCKNFRSSSKRWPWERPHWLFYILNKWSVCGEGSMQAV